MFGTTEAEVESLYPPKYLAELREAYRINLIDWARYTGGTADAFKVECLKILDWAHYPEAPENWVWAAREAVKEAFFPTLDKEGEW